MQDNGNTWGNIWAYCLLAKLRCVTERRLDCHDDPNIYSWDVFLKLAN